ncbi:MAG: MFS transporter [Oliverpabstia sp.]
MHCSMRQVVGLLLLLNVREGNYAIFFVGISVMGICFGSLMGVYPGFTADQFGTKNSSVNYGIMFIGFAVAGILGPTIVSKIVSAYGIYTKAFYVAAGLAAAGIILSGIYQKLNKK